MPFKKKKKSASSNGSSGRRVGRPCKRPTKVVSFRYNSTALSGEAKREYQSSPASPAADGSFHTAQSSRPQSHLGRKRRQFSAVDPELIKGLEAPHILLSKMNKFTLKKGQFEKQNQEWLDSCQKLALYFHEYRKVYVALEQRKRDLRNRNNKNDWSKTTSRSESLTPPGNFQQESAPPISP